MPTTADLPGHQTQWRTALKPDANMSSVASLMSTFTEIQYQASIDNRLKHFSVMERSQSTLLL
jgi:hypothetical protein